MSFTLEGDFGSAIFSTNGNSRYLELDTAASLNFFKKISILKTNITQNSFGLFSFVYAPRQTEARFASLSVPKHLLSKRTNGCVWNPKGKVNQRTTTIGMSPIEYNGEQCPDAYLGDCLEKIMGSGNDIRDIFATEEGRILFSQIVSLLYQGLGNSFYDLVWYGQHPLITDADTNDWYAVDDQEWADYKDQQDAAGGIMTMVDGFKTQGLANYNVDIPVADISADGTAFIGSATAHFDDVLAAQNTEMKMASKRPSLDGRMNKSVLLTDARIYAKYEEEMQAKFPTLPEMFRYFYNGKFCQAAGCDGAAPVEGVLKYKGHLVVCMDEWQEFNDITGTNTFRTLAVTPGVLGLAFDVPDVKQFSGMGMRITQHLDSPWKGKIFMDTTFKIGPGIIDENYLVNASRTFVPE